MSLQTKTPGAGKQPGVTIESGRRNFTASHIARGIACGLLVSASAIFTGVSLARCTSHAMHGTITPAPVNPALVFSDTKSEAVATPTDKRGFVTPKFWGWCSRIALMVSGGVRLSARTAARLGTCV